MGAYLLRRLLLLIPTLWAIITLNFFIVQIAPGGPVDQALAAIQFGSASGIPGVQNGGMQSSRPQNGVMNVNRATTAALAGSTRKWSPKSPTVTGSTNRYMSAT
ncbi:Oligopeptide transport system permease protein OppB (TC 3.A.1.5.1) [Cronobacter sakazakii 696]|nr:Oligopeptide transport system permease protein OppB (TC 3.A.1.5.1) [Cronobacter sakazakii 696]